MRRTFNWSSGPDIRPVLQITIDGLRADMIDRYVIGKQPVDLKGQAFWDAEKSSGAANWSLQFQVKFLFPKKAKISEND